MTTKQTKILLAGLVLLWLIVAIVLMSKPPDYNAFTNESEVVIEVNSNTTMMITPIITVTPIVTITVTPRPTQDVINCALRENQDKEECSSRSSSGSQSASDPTPSPVITPVPTQNIPEFPGTLFLAIISTIVLVHYGMKKREW